MVVLFCVICALSKARQIHYMPDINRLSTLVGRS